MILVTYDASSLSSNDKVKFYYALKGRDGKSGIIKLYDIQFLAKKVLFIPFQSKSDIIMFLKRWNLSYTIKEVILENEECVINES